jgi:post-segregation antitoxin (ccd killing protein)
MPLPPINVFRSQETANQISALLHLFGRQIDSGLIDDNSLYTRLAASHPGRSSNITNLGNHPDTDRFKMSAYTRTEAVHLAERQRDGACVPLAHPVPITLITSCGINLRRMGFERNELRTALHANQRDALKRSLMLIYMDALLTAEASNNTDVILTQLSTGYFAGGSRINRQSNQAYMRELCAEALMDAVSLYRTRSRALGASDELNIHVAAGLGDAGRTFHNNISDYCGRYALQAPAVHVLNSDEVAVTLSGIDNEKRISLQIAGADNSGRGALSGVIARGENPSTSEEGVRRLLSCAYEAATEAVQPQNIQLRGDLDVIQVRRARPLNVDRTVVSAIAAQVRQTNAQNYLHVNPEEPSAMMFMLQYSGIPTSLILGLCVAVIATIALASIPSLGLAPLTAACIGASAGIVSGTLAFFAMRNNSNNDEIGSAAFPAPTLV